MARQWIPPEPFDQKPNWLVTLVNGIPRFGQRKKVTVQLTEEIGEPKEIGKNLIDIECKEFRNNGTSTDLYTIETAKTKKEQKRKSYNLNIGKRFAKSGEFGFSVGADFFNIGGIGVSSKLKVEKEKTKEVSSSEEHTRTLSKEYGFDGGIPVPPKTFIKVKIKTYAVSYKADVHISVKMPMDAKLQVLAPRVDLCSCGGSRMIWITAQDYLKAFMERADDPQHDVDHRLLSYKTDTTLQYLGEITKVEVHKEYEHNIE
uniref:Uncharacterized protein n=1 Tax=Amphimedon queenslandica TaxID=400682 RepID=A0A1X7UPM4_AMPQE